MQWLYYLLEANLYLTLFYCFYRLFLQRETFYNTNRFYLIAATIVSFFLPLLTANAFHTYAGQAVGQTTFATGVYLTGTNTVKALPIPEATFQTVATSALPYLYLLVSAVFFANLLFGITKIAAKARAGKKTREGNVTIIALENSGEQAFSFFNLLFINSAFRGQTTVIEHEMAHIRQKHSLDVIFFEVIRIINWFNPFVWMMRTDVKLLHEYIADAATAGFSSSKHAYAMYLIENSFGIPTTKITNHIFNQSILKRRINMLNKKKSARSTRLRLLLLVPLVGSMVATSTMAFTKAYGIIDVSATVAPTPTPVPQEQKKRYTFKRNLKYDSKKNSFISDDKRLLVVNGKIISAPTVTGIDKADNITFLDAAQGLKKYGEKGKFGIVEATGKATTINYLAPPPPRRADVKRFPPPHVLKDPKEHVYTKWEMDPVTKKRIVVEKKLYVINGKPVENLAGIFGYVDAETKTILDPTAAQSKYGDAGMYGAVELTGSNIKSVGDVEPPPPRKASKKSAGTPHKDIPSPATHHVKFPAPVIKNDPSRKKFPAPSVRKSPSEVKKDQIKFPPPTVVDDPPPTPKKQVGNSTTLKPKATFMYKADTITSAKDASGLSLRGNVTVAANGASLKGDKADYDKKTGKLKIEQ